MKIDINVPDGEMGGWKVETFRVTEQGAMLHNLRCVFDPLTAGRKIVPGEYKRLTRNGSMVMSNVPSEVYDHLDFIHYAAYHGGNILINGLGLGMALSGLLQRANIISPADKIEQIIVVEKSADVIALVGPSITDPRVRIVHADALTYKPPKGMRFGAVWHDIWDDICSDNLPEMHKLHRKYGGKTDWQGSWCRGLCERGRRQGSY